MDDLIKFLRARLDEREAKARAAGIKVLDDDCRHLVTAPESLSWNVVRESDYVYVQDAGGTNVALASDVSMMEQDWEAITAGRADLIADNDPAWVLADVAGKQHIVEQAQLLEHAVRRDPSDTLYAARDALRAVVKWLALPYAGRADYRQEWKP